MARPSPCATAIGKMLSCMPLNKMDLVRSILTLTVRASKRADLLAMKRGKFSAPGIKSFN
ncbi:hypothetical protein MGSAQ_001719 [marine sediment metagenome]|uniref:Uncharacterized protein n=1 Tax=marine sediment metagenome TaxID=412755 RepID=A0A1B6NTJ6_9ZZZZ